MKSKMLSLFLCYVMLLAVIGVVLAWRWFFAFGEHDHWFGALFGSMGIWIVLMLPEGIRGYWTGHWKS